MSNFDEPANMQSNQVDDKLQEVSRVRIRAFMLTLGYGVFGGAILLGTLIAVFIPAFRWAKEARDKIPAGQQAELELKAFLAERPLLIVGAFAVTALGLILMLAGIQIWKRSFGPDGLPPRKMLYGLIALPLMLAAMGTAFAATRGGLQLVLIAPMMVGVCLFLVPLYIGILAIGTLTLARNVVGCRQTTVDDEDLPRKEREFFESLTDDAASAGLRLVGNFHKTFPADRLRRVWVEPNQTFFISADMFRLGNKKQQAITAYGACEDGAYFEVTNFESHQAQIPDSLKHRIEPIPGADVLELVQRLVQLMSDHFDATGARPLQIDPADEQALSQYGLGILMKAQRKQSPSMDLMWMASPFLECQQTVPPGTPWQGDADDELEAYDEVRELVASSL